MDNAEARRLLEAERERLTQARDASRSLLEEAREAQNTELSSLDQHPADSGTEVFEQEKDQAVAQRVDEELAGVEAAFDRLEAGTYGTCEACGRPIGDERLRAMPAARLCIEDQARAERQGG